LLRPLLGRASPAPTRYPNHISIRYNIPIMPATKRYVLIAATLGAFLIPFMGSAINIALPSIGDEFEMEATLLPWVSTAYLIAAAAFLVPFGKLGDIYGRKKIFTLGVVVFTLSSLMAALSTSSAMLIASRVIQGISGAMIFGTSVAMLKIGRAHV
jgi:MFS family permease